MSPSLGNKYPKHERVGTFLILGIRLGELAKYTEFGAGEMVQSAVFALPS